MTEKHLEGNGFQFEIVGVQDKKVRNSEIQLYVQYYILPHLTSLNIETHHMEVKWWQLNSYYYPGTNHTLSVYNTTSLQQLSYLEEAIGIDLHFLSPTNL